MFAELDFRALARSIAVMNAAGYAWLRGLLSGHLTHDRSVAPPRVLLATTVFVAAASVTAPHAYATFLPGNYDVLTNRYTRASWVWFISQCQSRADDCVHVSGEPRLKFYAYYTGDAHLANGRYMVTVDVPDGLSCPGPSMATRDTYSWDEKSLAGTIESVYDSGCLNGPPGSQFWTFALQRL